LSANYFNINMHAGRKNTQKYRRYVKQKKKTNNELIIVFNQNFHFTNIRVYDVLDI